MLESPRVNTEHMNIIIVHLASLLSKGVKNPKIKTVQEKPTGTSLIIPVSGFLKFIFLYAIYNIFLYSDKKSSTAFFAAFNRVIDAKP